MHRVAHRMHSFSILRLLDLLARRVMLQAAQASLLWGAARVAADESLPVAWRALLAAILGAASILAGALWFLVAQVTIHACSHPGSFSGSKRADVIVGTALCAENLQGLRHYTVLHGFHHRFTNSRLDPNSVRAGESWLHYVSTLYARQWQFMGREEYLREYRRAYPDEVAGEPRGGSAPIRWIQRVWREYGVMLRRLALVCAVLALSVALFGGLGALLTLLFWLLPVLVAYVLLADFAYRSHRGLPPRVECQPYRGQDTHALKEGVIIRALNLLTWDFYNHRAHHVRPAVSVWADDGARSAS